MKIPLYVERDEVYWALSMPLTAFRFEPHYGSLYEVFD